ncbi:hypothetical protein F4778DRAFT_85122 [Xylariomycetidae sp. FL2044]|nr:hypothetical protein F4778DRAFT_85122 [Xylariomycetidae sp. FL2044]
MSAPVFTFVNATGTPDLSQGEARRMRAHITKTNFAKRRQRRGVAGATKTIGHKEKSYDSGTELGVPVRRIRTLSSTLILPASVSPEEGQSQLIHLFTGPEST